jgi:nucleoid-associated protein YgaU
MPVRKSNDDVDEQSTADQKEQELQAKVKELQESQRQRLEDAKERIRARRQGPKQEEMRTYIVQAGDTLAKIAQQLYQDGSRWDEIYEANKDQIADPNVIQVGQELVIP